MQGVPQVRFKYDYAGGWGKYRKAKYWRRFKNRCSSYDGPQLPLLVAACKAPNGTYWTIQPGSAGSRISDSTPGFRSRRTSSSISRTGRASCPCSRPIPIGRTRARGRESSGRLTYLGKPVHGFGATPKGAPKDGYGRNVYIDTFNSSYGPGWKREAGILTHKGTGTFCHSFVPQRPFSWYPSRDVRPAAPGERYRVTVSGPGVTPVVQVEISGLAGVDRSRDKEFDSAFDRVMAGDTLCAGER